MKLTVFYITHKKTKKRKHFALNSEAKAYLKHDHEEHETFFEDHPDEVVFTNKYEIVEYLNNEED